MSTPTPDDLVRALSAAGAAHHDDEQNALGGERDEHSPGWFAAYVLGPLRDSATPATLSEWLKQVEAGGDDRARAAAHHVLKRLGV